MKVVPIQKQSKKKQKEHARKFRQTNGMNTGTRDMGKQRSEKFADILQEEIDKYENGN